MKTRGLKMGIDCKHNMVISMSGFTKCTMCKSYVKFVNGKHVVIDVKDTKKTTSLDSIINSIDKVLH